MMQYSFFSFTDHHRLSLCMVIAAGKNYFLFCVTGKLKKPLTEHGLFFYHCVVRVLVTSECDSCHICDLITCILKLIYYALFEQVDIISCTPDEI